ncbi:hypothetical protein BU24DRAFT_31465 [Aaosphaeria arxii CBS 175.79]|uniref:Uncharacterized protein n=1 Tax=Aaosphaeria arxii CBS 175.79 TaxID=1450172 RepID=A0A6A5Y975_9PLEO|nr:uncharacterized protein BU24DRAFT_31465 [Aaosphaeria arxii CBS 175.79]KAF2021879.1 hypothetical protein BU24DRAFT_31465 [Aaosphaeria arxii CBS 175.79]
MIHGHDKLYHSQRRKRVKTAQISVSAISKPTNADMRLAIQALRYGARGCSLLFPSYWVLKRSIRTSAAWLLPMPALHQSLLTAEQKAAAAHAISGSSGLVSPPSFLVHFAASHRPSILNHLSHHTTANRAVMNQPAPRSSNDHADADCTLPPRPASNS